jgi:hypothetical protein
MSARHRIGAAVIDARARILARQDADRWIDEGGSLDRERPRLSPGGGRRKVTTSMRCSTTLQCPNATP